MFAHFLLNVFTIPSGLYILIGFFALIVLAIVLWSSPKETQEKSDNLKPGHAADAGDSKE